MKVLKIGDMMKKYIVQFQEFKGKKMVGSTLFELSKEQYVELKDVVKNEI